MPEPLEGTLLDGRYRIGIEIGRGGMSTVYEAEDLQLARRVAVKVVLGNESADVAERLFREARAAARADHPSVVTVFAQGTDPSGIDYLVLERLDGEDLAARIARVGPLPADFVIGLAIDVADALAHVGDAGIVHRDLKPSNIFLARRGLRVDQVKLLDFGVAKHLDMHKLTAPGEALGTPAYMAPEQVLGLEIDARADVYAFGVVLFECLTGRLPYSGKGVHALSDEIVRGATRRPSALRPDVPPALDAIVARCTAREPEHRHQTARDLCSALLELERPPPRRP